MSELDLEEQRIVSATTRETSEGVEASPPIQTVVTGVLIGFQDEGRTPLVMTNSPVMESARPARATVDLHGSHIGRQVVLVFENGDLRRPIIVGCLQRADGALVAPRPGTVDIDADGERLIVTAREQLVLRCGKASITLTRSGKVLIEGAYVSSRSSGVNRIKGGSVQLN